MIERESSEQRSVPFENDQIFRTSRIECEVCDCIFGRNKIRVVQLSLKFLGVFGKDDAIASTSYLTWIHALTVYVKDSCARNHDILAPLHNALNSPNWHLTTRGIDHFRRTREIIPQTPLLFVAKQHHKFDPMGDARLF